MPFDATPSITCRSAGAARVKFLTVFVTELLLVTVVGMFAPPAIQVATLAVLLSVLAAMAFVNLDLQGEQQTRFDALFEQLQIPMTLAADHPLFNDYEKFAAALVRIANNRSPLFRQMAGFHLSSICNEIDQLGKGKVLFRSTETWRAAYRAVLESLTVKAYYSVAWVRTGDYWDDPPGRHGMQLNFELVERGYRIERLVILPDNLWPYDQDLPTPEIRHWLDQQHDRGIVLSLVREHQLADEPDLQCDFGIYGNQAVGYQQLDDHSRTVSYLLDFDPQARKKALDRLQRLALYATPYRKGG